MPCECHRHSEVVVTGSIHCRIINVVRCIAVPSIYNQRKNPHSPVGSVPFVGLFPQYSLTVRLSAAEAQRVLTGEDAVHGIVPAGMVVIRAGHGIVPHPGVGESRLGAPGVCQVICPKES